jgi:hypothetical protein
MAWQSEKYSFCFTKSLDAYQRKGFSVFGLIWLLIQRYIWFVYKIFNGLLLHRGYMPMLSLLIKLFKFENNEFAVAFQ